MESKRWAGDMCKEEVVGREGGQGDREGGQKGGGGEGRERGRAMRTRG